MGYRWRECQVWVISGENFELAFNLLPLNLKKLSSRIRLIGDVKFTTRICVDQLIGTLFGTVTPNPALTLKAEVGELYHTR